MIDWADPTTWSAVPVIGTFAAWVGRVHQRVGRNETDITDVRDALAEHVKLDTEMYQRIANMEGKIDSMHGMVERIERRQK